MVIIAILIGCILGALIGINAPMISYTYSSYLAIAIIAALDSVFGGITSVIKKNFNLKIFITGFFGNAILSILLTILGEKLNVDIYLAAIVVFVGRMFTNLAIIRRYYVDKWSKKIENKKGNIDILNVKLDEEKIKKLLCQKGFYKAYHMNKEKWITITLDETLSDKEIMEYVSESYKFTLKNE